MHILQLGLVVLYSLMLLYEVRIGLVEYAAFKLLTDTADRQRLYRRWLIRGLLVFSGASVAGLAILGRSYALVQLPDEFGALSQRLRISLPDVHFSSGFYVGFGASIFVGAILGGVIAARLADRGRSITVGEIQALMPRNWPETGHTFLLSLNAGLGEELLFRLFIPLLLTLLSGNAIFAFLVSGAVFGLMHVYQGALGVLMTMFLGFVLSYIYLATGSVWIVVAIHAGIDVLGLVVRPTVIRLLRSSQADAVAELP